MDSTQSEKSTPDRSTPGSDKKFTEPGSDDDSTTVDSSGKTETDAEELSPEEQMALYEESLKDTDWGHQPC